jgi:hypothetical protein
VLTDSSGELCVPGLQLALLEGETSWGSLSNPGPGFADSVEHSHTEVHGSRIDSYRCVLEGGRGLRAIG